MDLPEPIFLLILAIHTYIHQSALLMTHETFKGFDKDLLKKIGKDQISCHKWNQFSDEQKFEEVFTVLKEDYMKGMQELFTFTLT